MCFLYPFPSSLEGILRELLYENDAPRYPNHHRVRLSIMSPGLHHEIWIPFIPPDDMSVERVLISIERVLQSDKKWLFAGTMRVTFVHAALPVGNGRLGVSTRQLSSSWVEMLGRKKSIIQIPRDEHDMCCARAIVVAVAQLNRAPAKRKRTPWHEKVRRYASVQVRLAKELLAEAGIGADEPCGLPEWEKFQSVLSKKNFSLVVVSRDSFNTVVYHGGDGKLVCLYLADNHYSVITRLPAFLGARYVCGHCFGRSRSAAHHRCKLSCEFCGGKSTCGWEGDGEFCSACGITFRNATCLAGHVARGICDVRVACPTCGKWYKKKLASGAEGVHTCGHDYCPVCHAMMPKGHECYMQPAKTCKDEFKSRPYVFYDFESMMLEDGRHQPNLCVVHRVCTRCMDLPMEEGVACDCGRERRIFKGEDTLEQFGAYLFAGRLKGCICIAYNSSGYDSYFVLDFVHRKVIKPSVITTGHKILRLEAEGVTFIDSLNFFPMALSKLPEAFGLEELTKGYFPHLWNTLENQNYVGTVPDASFYGPDQMHQTKRASFYEWYDEQRDVAFDLQRELEKYCISDVDILQRCCGVFRNLFVENTGLEPFTKTFTIAGACNRVYRTSFLAPATIGVIPSTGSFEGGLSSIGLCWLMHMERQTGRRIKHAGNDDTQVVAGRAVDGVDDEGDVYLFHGCFRHSCPRCFPNREAEHPVKKDVTHRENHGQTLAFEHALRSSGRSLHVQWECDFRAEMTSHHRRLMRLLSAYDPIKPRDAFYGGRTEAIGLYREAAPEKGEWLKYVDFNSLYPFINKYARYPVKHPVVVRGEDIPEEVEGLVKCLVLPPAKLFLPVLPWRNGEGKLLFPLCRSCGESGQTHACMHTSPEDRVLIGTWTSPELSKAVECGYKILQRIEAWHYPNTSQYDPETRTGGIWAAFINKWVKLKQEASGYPKGCDAPEERAEYVAAWKRREGIELEPGKISHNPGLRSLAKLLANSHWGKFGQRSDKSKVVYTADVSDYVKLMHDPHIQVQDVVYANEESVAVYSKVKGEESDPGSARTNCVLAAYTTANARLRLYNAMERLDRRVLYTDTDSIIYVHKRGEWNPDTGDFLGDLKDEYPRQELTQYVGLGAKNYAIRFADGTCECKVRGFTLNYQTSKLIDFDTMLEMLREGVGNKTVTTTRPHAIVREGQVGLGGMYTRSQEKTYRMVYDKRRILPDGVSTVPLGWLDGDDVTAGDI